MADNKKDHIGYKKPTPHPTVNSNDNSKTYFEGLENQDYGETLLSQSAIRDAVSRVGSSRGELSKAATNAFWGFNHRNVGVQVKPNSDNHGLTFFTRPRLNLSYDNIAGVRTFAPLLTDDQFTMARAIRCILDPVSHKGIENTGLRESSTARNVSGTISSPIVDPLNPFMPVLSNLLVSISGWPDSVMDTHTSPNGIANESWSMIDSLPVDNSTNDITVNLRNISGDPISLLAHVWTQYASRVSEGSMLPWPEAIAENEKAYDTRIYRLVLDSRRKYITKFAACGYGVPYVNPLGADFNYDSAQPVIQDNQEKSIPFKCSGFIYNDPILIIEFNSLVAEFNKAMGNGMRDQQMVKLKDEEKDYFNFQSYPRIAEDGTMELEWWVNRQDYNDAAAELAAFNPNQYIR